MKKSDINIFISYRSINANEARYIVDLLETGLENVWFAENVVLSANYETFEQSLDENIESAIKKSTYAILLTNHSWDKSENCQKEWEIISEKLPPQNIIQIYLPKEKVPELSIQLSKKIPGIIYNNNPNEIIEFINNHFLLDSEFYFSKPQSGEFSNFKFRYGNISIWSVLSIQEKPNLGIVGREHSYEFAGHLGNGIFASIDIDINPFEPPLKNFSMEEFNNFRKNPDRKAYHAIRKQAIQWLAKSNNTESSLHLKYFNDDVGYGVTYYKMWQSGKIAWTRYYFQWIDDKQNNRMVRADYQFSIVCSPNSFVHNSKREYIEKAKREFLKYIVYFEVMVDSYKYKSDPTLKYLPTKKEVTKKKWIGAIVGFVLSAILTYFIVSKNPDYPFLQQIIITLVISTIASIVFSNFLSKKDMNLYKTKIEEQVYIK